METGLYRLKKYSTLAMLVMYFFMVATFAFYLPNRTRNKTSLISRSMHFSLQRDANSTNPSVQVHCSFKALPENKRKTIYALSKVVAFTFVVIFVTVTLLQSQARPAYRLVAAVGHNQRCYLDLRVLRI